MSKGFLLSKAVVGSGSKVLTKREEKIQKFQPKTIELVDRAIKCGGACLYLSSLGIRLVGRINGI